MLKLALKLGESIILETGDGIVEIVLTEFRGLSGGVKKVALEFHAPQTVDIWRKKIYLERTENARNQETATTGNGSSEEGGECPRSSEADQE